MSVVVGQKGKRPAVKDTHTNAAWCQLAAGTPRLSVKFYSLVRVVVSLAAVQSDDISDLPLSLGRDLPRYAQNDGGLILGS